MLRITLPSTSSKSSRLVTCMLLGLVCFLIYEDPQFHPTAPKVIDVNDFQYKIISASEYQLTLPCREAYAIEILQNIDRDWSFYTERTRATPRGFVFPMASELDLENGVMDFSISRFAPSNFVRLKGGILEKVSENKYLYTMNRREVKNLFRSLGVCKRGTEPWFVITFAHSKSYGFEFFKLTVFLFCGVVLLVLIPGLRK